MYWTKRLLTGTTWLYLMTRPRLAFLNAAHEGGPTRRNFRRELDANLVEFDVVSGQLPVGTDFDGVVISGSRSSVYDDDPWIADTLEWVRGAIDAGLPCLGVCWGHQLLAEAIGGEVASRGEYELGYRTIEQTGESALFEGIDRTFTSFESHSDEVVDLPDDVRITAENDASIQGFEQQNVYAVQFHPEFDPETARKATEGKDEELPAERIEAVLEGITDESYASSRQSELVFENFLRIVQAEQPVAAD